MPVGRICSTDLYRKSLQSICVLARGCPPCDKRRQAACRGGGRARQTRRAGWCHLGGRCNECRTPSAMVGRLKAISRKEIPRLYLPPAGGGEVGGDGAGRGTRARSTCLGFPPPTSPRWGEARSRALAPKTPSGMFFCRNHLSTVCNTYAVGCQYAAYAQGTG
jgi:hypothetical protein